MYLQAKKQYEAFGVDAEKAMETLKNVPFTIQCWQGDDVSGFLSTGALSGGIQATGDYPGKARNFCELTADIEKAFSLIPGKKRLNLHAIYAVTDQAVPWDELTIQHFQPWLDWALPRGICLDFNPTYFSHPLAKLATLSSPDEEIRAFWVRHSKACRAICAQIGQRQGSPCLCNIWIPDGMKDIPADRLGPRLRLKRSLDEIYIEKYNKDYLLDCVEGKVFGIGLESYTVGSAEFYMNYAAKNGVLCLLDNGHYHPTESTADKIAAMLAFYDQIAVHITRHVRWDSDHVVRLNDEVTDIAMEIVRNGALQKTLIGLDYFDASINRVAAWVIGGRNLQKALLLALLTPHAALKKLQEENRGTQLLALQEELKTLPFGAIWDEYLRRANIPGSGWIESVEAYEREVQSERQPA
jgi:L-rhamnose isomerase